MRPRPTASRRRLVGQARTLFSGYSSDDLGIGRERALDITPRCGVLAVDRIFTGGEIASPLRHSVLRDRPREVLRLLCYLVLANSS
jgi:hypothetical protein